MLSRTSSLVLIAALASMSAFAAKDKPKATNMKLAFDPATSLVKWEGKKVTGKHNGEIKIKSGELMMAGEEIKGGEFVIDMATMSNADLTDSAYNKKLITHLKSDDFFNVEKFPTAVLKIKSAKSVPGFVGPTYEIVGDLTIKGKTNEVKFPAVVQTKDGKTTATANIVIDRTKWEIKYGSGKFFTGLGDKMINDEFQLDVALASK